MERTTVHIQEHCPEGTIAYIKMGSGWVPVLLNTEEVLACELREGDSFEWVPGPVLKAEDITQHPRKWDPGEAEELLKPWEEFKWE